MKSIIKTGILKFFGAVLAVAAIVASYHIADRQGVFAVSEVKFGLGEIDFKNGDEVELFVGLSAPFQDEDEVLIPVKFSLKNTGEKGLEDILLSFSYDSTGARTTMGLDQFIGPRGALNPDNFSHASNASAGRDYSNYHVKRLNLGASVTFGDAVRAHNLEPHWAFGFDQALGAKVNVTLDAAGLKRQRIALSYQIVVLEDGEDIVDWFKGYYISGVAMSLRAREGFFEYLLNVMGKGETMTAYLVSPEYGGIPIQGGTLWMPKNDHLSIKKVEVHPYSWSLLFN